MSFDLWAIFIASIFFVILIPGPLSLFMVSNSINHGILKSYPAFLGGVLASSIYLILSATGVGALITASPELFTYMKIAGALYLMFLGFITFKNTLKKKNSDNVAPKKVEKAKFSNLFTKAFFLGASNPKDIIFFMAFLPQFLSNEKDLLSQIIVIVISWIIVDLICKIGYGLLATTLKPLLISSGSTGIFGKITGILYVLAGFAAITLV